MKRPALIVRYTNDLVYECLVPSELDELSRKSPVLPNGYRRHKQHQWFTPNTSHPKLREHLSGGDCRHADFVKLVRIQRESAKGLPEA